MASGRMPPPGEPPGTPVMPEGACDCGGDPQGAHFHRSFVAGDHATRVVLAELIDRLTRAGIGQEDMWNLELILAEALNNVAEHAYPQGEGPVELRIERRVAGLACRIADQGQPMPSNDAPNPPLPDIEPPDNLPEGGFGWHIIRSLTADLSYRRKDGWNVLTMLVPLTPVEEKA